MTATEEIEKQILKNAEGILVEYYPEFKVGMDGYNSRLHWCIQESTNEFRDSYDEETKIEPDWNRHYESKSVAKKLDNGKWVGYTYWYGGGKHGEPEEMPWIEDAYFLEMKEEMRPVKIFTRIN